MNRIEIYIKPFCGHCRRAKQLLDSRGLEYTEIDVSRDRDRENEMIRRSGRYTAPQIFIDGEHFGDNRKLSAADASGEFDWLLSRKKGE